MGQKNSIPKETLSSHLPNVTRTSQSFSPITQPLNSITKKPNLIDKIKLFISQKKPKKFMSLHLGNSRHSILKSPPLRKKGLSFTQLKQSSLFTNVSDKEENIKIERKIKRHILTKDLNVNKIDMRSNQRHRTSLFESLGISGNSPNEKSPQKSMIRGFSINDPTIEIFPLKKKKNNGKNSASPRIHDLKKLEINTNIQSETEKSLNEMDRGKDSCKFKSPLIKIPKMNQMQKSDVEASLVSNYSKYLQKIKKNNENRDRDLTKKKAMKQMLQAQKEKKVNMNEFEFELKSIRNRDEDMALNDFNETMDHFRREKFRNELILNKNSPNFVIPPFITINSQNDKDRSIIKMNKISHDNESITKTRKQTLSPGGHSYNTILSSNFNPENPLLEKPFSNSKLIEDPQRKEFCRKNRQEDTFFQRNFTVLFNSENQNHDKGNNESKIYEKNDSKGELKEKLTPLRRLSRKFRQETLSPRNLSPLYNGPKNQSLEKINNESKSIDKVGGLIKLELYDKDKKGKFFKDYLKIHQELPLTSMSATLNTENHFYDKVITETKLSDQKDSNSSDSLGMGKNNENTKIVFSPKVREVFQSQSRRSMLSILSKNIPSVASIMNSAKDKPVKLFKNRKNLIFFKNKVIEIENSENKNVNIGSNDQRKDDLFYKIIKSGNSPTKYFLNEIEKKGFSH